MGKAVMCIVPQYLGLEKFRVCEASYDAFRGRIQFTIENDVIPDVPPEKDLPLVIPFYDKRKNGNDGLVLKGISIFAKGEHMFVLDAQIGGAKA